MMKQNHYIFFILLALLTLACLEKSLSQTLQKDRPAKPLRVISVSSSQELKEALDNAKAGDEINLADGTYKGKFVIAAGKNGTPLLPIMLQGSRNAILDAENTNTGYVLYLQSNYWILKGFTLTNGLKGLMMDGVQKTNVDGLRVFNIGEEAIHLRKFSCHNTVQHCDISQTGLKTADFGEGIYIGSAKNNWLQHSNGGPDRCDSNVIFSNKIGPNVAAEAIDVKEGTTGGIIQDNTFDSAGITGANSGDSWIDVKGNNYMIENNHGTNPGGNIFKDGYQVHCAVAGWGNNNEFRNNHCVVNTGGYGINIQLSGSNGTTSGNKVFSNNTVIGAAKGISNIALSN